MNLLPQRLRGLFRPRAEGTVDLLTGPIRGDLLGTEHLAERARALAREQVLAKGRVLPAPARLLERLDSNRRVLDAAYERISDATAAAGETDPAAEWLLDNYHVVQEHVQEVRAALPRGYYRELPELSQGALTGYPRIYEIAIALISHSEGRIALDNVDHFVQAFQEVQPLRIGELWALPAMLRLALIENVRRMALRTVQRLDEIAAADVWVRRIQEASERGGPRLNATLHDLLETPSRLTATFVTRLLGQLRVTGGASPALGRLETWLHHEGHGADDAAARATQRLVQTQLTMANSITSLRTVGRRDWRTFVEHQSAIEAVLRTDPDGAYPRMTFSTRDRYRHVVERLARSSGRDEVAVAELVVARALEAPDDDPARRHVGYYLIGDGLPGFERSIGAGPRGWYRVVRALRAHPDLVLLGGLALLTLAALSAVNLLAGLSVVRVAWPLILLFTFLPAWDIAISSVNQLVTAVVPPRPLPSLDLRDGIPPELRTVVVVPTLLADPDDARHHVEQLEVLYLANRDDHLHFAILGDFLDAPRESMPGDEEILSALVAAIAELNAQHPGADGDRFFALHRPRRWNPAEGVWMGWERKRGKLSDFNRLLRKGTRDPFSVVTGDTEVLRQVRYVITLDADTMLPQGAAAALIGKMAHPLHRPRYSEEKGRIVAGYGILQPRVGVSLPSAHRTRFAEILSGQPGLDPYTTAVSDVYQDLYGEGSFTGKGIYDVEAFALATRGRFPENTLLSHDLIEGNYARAGLSTSVVVYDDYPSGYLPHARRAHRWIRGDWQLLPWLGRTVPGPEGPERNRLSLLSRWKILDNLRRSTVPISELALFFAGWTLLAGSPITWTLLALGAVVAPWVVSIVIALLRPPVDKSWRAYYGAVWRDAVNGAEQFFLALTFLPHQAWLSLDAIGRTLWRMAVSRRRLLEWVSAAQVQRQQPSSVAAHLRILGPPVAAVLAAMGAIAGLSIWHAVTGTPGTAPLPLLVSMFPLAILWCASPWIAARLSVPRPEAGTLTPALRATAERYARQHWRYFEEHATRETHWLAPDNVQFDPENVAAMRTSPTNIGLQLLATATAGGFGWIAPEGMVERIERIFATLDRLPRYRGHFYNWYALDDLRVLEPAYVSTVDSGNLAGHLLALAEACAETAGTHPELSARLHTLAERARAFAMAMEFGFLFDRENRLLSIGFHPESHQLDAACYDLLASESRLATFIAIAKGDLAPAVWFRLGRRLIRNEGDELMVSWSGSAFEYLMPHLVMRSFDGTLLDVSDRAAVRAQIRHGLARGVPWGVSESAYNVRDKELTYQYRAFGVPGLALKRGLGRDLVVAPYASALAAQLYPREAMTNLAVLERMGALGDYGFWDALDFTRPAPDERFAMVETVMAHHAGMTIVALANVLHDKVWQRHFHAVPLVRAAELLLQERMPRRLRIEETPHVREAAARRATTPEPHTVRRITRLDTPHPHVVLLGDLPRTVMVTQAGAGWSRHEGLAVTRWRPDGTMEGSGQFCYLHDLTTGRTWSAGHQPMCVPADEYVAEFAPDRATLIRRDGAIETRTEIVVVSQDAAEVRRVTVTNHDHVAHEIELTSYAEIAMSPPDADAAHPAFANLFVETEWHEWCAAITARRRPRTDEEHNPWCAHLVDNGPERPGRPTCETDRARFIGRGRSVRNPVAVEHPGALSGTTGAVLDPIAAIRVRVRLAPGASHAVSFTTLVADTRARLFELADRYHDPHASRRALDLAWMAAQIDLRETGLDGAAVAASQQLAGHLIHPHHLLRASATELVQNRGHQALLWGQGISGDLPIVLATINARAGLATLRELFQAHHFLRRRGLVFDLVVVVSEPHDYLQELRQAITEEMTAANDANVDVPGGVFLRRRDGFGADDYRMLSTVALAHVPCDGRPLSRIVSGGVPEEPSRRALPFRAIGAPPTGATRSPEAPMDGNGHGRLDEDGNYRIAVVGNHVPPAPWINVIANRHGGFLVSERGTGCTWAASAYFYRLTPWHNDPVSDPACDVIYLHDEERNEHWSPTPAPAGDGGVFTVTHAPGRSTFVHRRGEIESTLTLGTPPDAAAKLSLLELTNHGRTTRTLTLTAYAEWTLGVRREVTQSLVRTWHDSDSGAMMANCTLEAAFAERIAYLAVSGTVASHTGDRTAFIGRHGTLADPAALQRQHLDGRTGMGLDPCAALRRRVTIAPGETVRVAVVLGSERGEEATREAITRFRDPEAARVALDASRDAWEARLGVIQAQTPDPTFDAMINRWSLYQAFSSRYWGRMGLYQSSGAFGFRDQLQDVMAFVYAEPAVTREHLLRAASRQFTEGDVQHWWHPHSGRGVRTRFSDDLAWLPLATEHYVRVTGDTSVLDEEVPFLAMPPLAPDEHERYDLPDVAAERASLYAHCLRALRRAATRGAHGLPLIGTGDWNDGFSSVGDQGRGESVWMAWFLIVNCRRFAAIARTRGDHAAADELERLAGEYAAAAEKHAWDGAWYRRAWFDDGTPLGTATADECRIDSIAQSWSVLAGTSPVERQREAVASLKQELVMEDARIIRLLAPPFDEGDLDPGYIKGYLPGVRENGAQYTHAALWAVQAMAELGDADAAWRHFQMINPLTRTATPDDVATYRVEPYAIAADIYTAEDHVGRGGWTWYTGSAAWFYRVGLETILGFHKEGDSLRIRPCVPRDWPGFTITYRHGSSTYEIEIETPGIIRERGAVVTLDDTPVADEVIPLVDDGQRHRVRVRGVGR